MSEAPSNDPYAVVTFIRGCPSVWDREEVYYKFRKMLEDEPDSIDRDMAILDFEDALKDREKIIKIGSKMHDENGEYELNSLINKLSFKKKIDSPKINQALDGCWHRRNSNDNC